MRGKAFIIMILSGLCSAPLCFPRQYHVVEYEKNWTDAQTYCRQHYKDLATIASQEDVTMLSHDLGYCQRQAWIGLHNDINTWGWSLENTSNYNEGEAEFRSWNHGEPNALTEEDCVKFRNGKWWDDPCYKKIHFVCYNAQGSDRFHVVKETKNWTEAQRYCRENYTDLAIVRNEDENRNISSLVRPNTTFVWIGLFRVFWKWSDGSTMSFTNWQQKPVGRQEDTCVVTSSNGKWQARPCSERKSFVCYGAANETNQPQWTLKRQCCKSCETKVGD